MKRFIVMGLGRFGSILASSLYQAGHDVIALDLDEDAVDAMGPRVSRAMVGDGTQKALLAEIGAREADAFLICTGSNLAASVLALLAARDLGIGEIYVKVHSEEHARIADALGATEIVFPEKMSAQSLATRLTSGKLLHYVQFTEEFSIQEMTVPDNWTGKTLRELELPQKFQVQVVAVHDILRDKITLPDADRPLTPSDTLLVAGVPTVLQKLVKLR